MSRVPTMPRSTEVQHPATEGARARGTSPSLSAGVYFVVVFAILQVISATDRSALAIMVDDVKASLSLTDVQMGLVQGAAFMIFYATLGVVIGAAVDRYSRRWIMFMGVTGWSLAAAGVGLVTSFEQLFLARALVGLAEASLGPCVASLAADYFPPRRLAIVMSVYVAGSMAGTALSMAAGGWLLDNVGAIAGGLAFGLAELEHWRLAILAMALPGLLIAPLALTLREPKRQAYGGASGFGWSEFGFFLKTNRRVVASLLGAYALMGMGSWPAIMWAAPYARRVLGLTATEIGSVMGLVIGLLGIGSALLAGTIADFFVGRGVKDAAMRMAIAAFVVSFPLILMGFTLNSSALLIVSLIAAQCLLQSQAGPGLALTQMITPSRFRGRMTSLYIVTTSVAAVAIGPLLVGALTDLVYRSPMRVGWSVATLAGICIPLAAGLMISVRPQILRVLQRQTAETGGVDLAAKRQEPVPVASHIH